MFRRLLIIIIAFLSLGNILLGNSGEFKIDSTFKSVLLNDRMVCFKDNTNSLTIKSIQNQEFYSMEKGKLNLGYSNSSFWFKINLKSAITENSILSFVNRNHYLENCDVYLLQDSLLSTWNIGAESSHKNDVISFILNPHESVELFVHVKSKTALRINFLLFEQEKLVKTNHLNNIYTGFFLGIFAFILLLSLFIWLVLHEKLYLVFGIYIFLSGFYLVGYENILPKILLFGKFNFLLRSTVAIVPIIQICYIIFSKWFFELKDNQSKITKLLNAFIILSIFHFAIFFFNFELGTKIIYFTTPLISLTLLGISIYLWLWKKNKFVRFYSIATFLYIIGIYIQVMANIGVISNFVLSLYALKTSYLILLSVYAYALTDKFIIYSKDYTHLLNEKVEERTVELEDALLRLKKRRQQLIQSEKMTSIGILTAGLAHELNNPLNFINGGLEIIRNKKIEEPNRFDSIMDNALDYIQDGMNKSTDIVSSILEFSYRKDYKIEHKNIEDIIDRTLLVLNPKLTSEIKINKNYNLNTKIPLYRAKIHQLFVSILENAIYYARLSSTSPEISISTRVNSNFYEVAISNNGPQINKDSLHSIFDPFYTTKDVGEGTGLGLSNAVSIIQEHNGNIEAKNLPDKGVEFIIKLPIHT